MGMPVVRCIRKDGNEEHDTLSNRHCSICNHLLFLSGITCECTKNKVVCLNHANHMCTCEAKERRLHIRYTMYELDLIASELCSVVSEQQKYEVLLPLNHTNAAGADQAKSSK